MFETRTRKDGKPDGRAKRAEHLATLDVYLRKPHTVDECAEKVGVTRRAIYFMLRELDGHEGRRVVKYGSAREGRYQILRKD